MENKYAAYRKIRYNRTYRPLGRITWWRIVLGIALLVFALLLSGTVSQSLAFRGHYKAAEKLMIVPPWMERYKPGTKAFIESGALLENGSYDAAYEKVAEVDSEVLSPNSRKAYRAVCETLEDHFREIGKEEDLKKAERLLEILEQLPEN